MLDIRRRDFITLLGGTVVAGAPCRACSSRHTSDRLSARHIGRYIRQKAHHALARFQVTCHTWKLSERESDD